MNAGTITLNGTVFRRAQRYAKEHNVSVDAFVEELVIKAIGVSKRKQTVDRKRFRLKAIDELSPRVRSLIGAGRISEGANDDLNGRNARMEYLEEKYRV